MAGRGEGLRRSSAEKLEIVRKIGFGGDGGIDEYLLLRYALIRIMCGFLGSSLGYFFF